MSFGTSTFYGIQVPWRCVVRNPANSGGSWPDTKWPHKITQQTFRTHYNVKSREKNPNGLIHDPCTVGMWSSRSAVTNLWSYPSNERLTFKLCQWSSSRWRCVVEDFLSVWQEAMHCRRLDGDAIGEDCESKALCIWFVQGTIDWIFDDRLN